MSTAADQLRIVDRAMRLPAFASIVATPSATLPVAGTVHNTNTLLGRNGFVGVKTGSDRAAGGCFAFRAIRWCDGKRTTITGVVLGQPGYDLIDAGLAAADAMVDRIAGDRAGRAHRNNSRRQELCPRARSAENRCRRNQHTRRKPLTRTLWPPAAFGMAVIVAVIAAGCGATPSSSGTSTAAAADTGSNTTTAAHTSTDSHTST